MCFFYNFSFFGNAIVDGKLLPDDCDFCTFIRYDEIGGEGWMLMGHFLDVEEALNKPSTEYFRYKKKLEGIFLYEPESDLEKLVLIKEIHDRTIGT